MQREQQSKPAQDPWMRPSEAAALLKVTRATVMNRIARGLYRKKLFGGLTFVHRDDVAEAAKEAA